MWGSGSRDEASYRGYVLFDNTTVFGARTAFEWDPARPYDLPSGVNLRSLMDVLEGIVLFNDIAIDNSSRDWVAWPELAAVSEGAGSFFHDTAIMIASRDHYGPMHEVLADVASENLAQLLESGELVRQLGFMPSSRELDVLPPFYRDSDEFLMRTWNTLDLRSASGAATWERLETLADSLDGQNPSLRNFAFFAFRGFFYQQLAHAVSASYVPHSWRSGLIRSQLEAPTRQFADLVLDQGARLREGLRTKINHEFGSVALSADFPLIASYVINQCSNRSSLLSTAVDVRRNAKAAAFRNWIYEIEGKLRTQEDLVGIRQAQEELRTVVHELERELGLTPRDKQQVTVKLGVPLVSAETTAGVSRSLPSWVTRTLRRRTHLVFLRELVRESARLTPFALAFRQLAP